MGYNADKHMNTLLEKISSQQMSKGTRESPAMSCQDIYNCHGDSFKSGTLSCVCDDEVLALLLCNR